MKKIFSTLLAIAMVLSLTIIPVTAEKEATFPNPNAESDRGTALHYGWYFETNPNDDGWSAIDADGDGNNWSWGFGESFETYEGLGVMISASFNGAVLTPDNWLLSPEFVAGEYMTFYYGPQDSEYNVENFGVYISTDGGDNWSEELGYFTAGLDFVQGEIDLTDYTGMPVQIAFRHYNSTDQFYLNIDNVEIWGDENSVPDPPEGPVPTYSWNFEEDPAVQGWTWTDNDGDGSNWEWQFDAGFTVHEGDGIMASASYSDEVGPLFPDNWLISPVFTAGDTLTFYIAGQDAFFCEEYVGVYVSTDGGESWSDEIDGFISAAYYEQHTIDLSEYTGTDIQVAFRHYNCSEMYYLNLDKVEVWGGESEEDVIPGDVNGDGTVSVIDATLAIRAAIGLEVLTENALAAADLDGDGTVSVTEANSIVRIGIGI